MISTGCFFKLCREISGFSLRDVEDKTGVSNAYLSQIEKDKIKNPSFRVIVVLCKFYNITVEKFIEITGQEEGKVINPEKIKSGDTLVVLMKSRYDQSDNRCKDVVHVVAKEDSLNSSSKTVKIEDILEHISS